ncbi:ORF6N domain-containing protein [Anaerotruncus colihominis]|uniref:ORF6N domain-containing protein n=1 Tax=Anaerotruncus colihominis TaxID=169435 RepID=UPI0034678597
MAPRQTWPRGTASRNFRENRDKFIEGTDYFKVSPDDFRRAIEEMDIRQSNVVTVLTESGYLMIVKSLHDDLAWAVQREWKGYTLPSLPGTPEENRCCSR